MANIRSTTLALLATATLTAVSPWTLAQVPQPEAAPTAAANAQGVAPEAATTAQKMEARLSFSKGMKAFNDKKFEDALTAFRQSYGTVASPNSHLMIARTLKNMGRSVDAYDEYQAVTIEAEAAAAANPKYQKAADAATADLAAVSTTIGLIRVSGTGSATADSRLTVGGRVVERDKWNDAIAVEPGTVVVELTGKPSKSVSVAAGQTASVDLAPPAPLPPSDPIGDEPPAKQTPYSGPDRMFMTYIAGGIGALGLITWGIFGGLALSKHSDLEDQCTDNRCPADAQSDADEGEAYVAVSNVGFAIGLVGILAGAGFLTWHYLEQDEAASDDSVAGEVSVGPGSVHMKLSF